MSKLWVVGFAMLALACGHRRLSGSELDRVQRPAFISRIEDDAGPRALVFREDGAYGGKLKKLDAKEADRRLAVKLQRGLTRFELSDRLRATTLSGLPAESPWTHAVDPASVATVLESFLVEEVPANPPDYELLRPLGADAVVEFVISEYGMHSRNGRAGAYFKGYARMFFLDGAEAWRHPIDEDELELSTPHLDPFAVGKTPELYRARMVALVDRLAKRFVSELSPKDRRGGPAVKPVTRELSAPPDDTNRTGKENRPPPAAPEEDALPPGELPDPD
ncbi:MAG: hypothetical protein M3Y59_05300 [Myxococcota bacterium]|nr:hypothetical protein [Myxococcota bacterium]